MRITVLALFVGLLFAPLSAAAVEPPDMDIELLGEYAQGVIDTAERVLARSNPGDGTNCNETSARWEAVRHVQESLVFVDETVAQPSRDVHRSLCFAHDIQELEHYARSLFDLAMENACSSREVYLDAFDIVWRGIYNLRRYGLNPYVQRPITGTGGELTDAAQPDESILYCPYFETYANQSVAFHGCKGTLIPNLSVEGVEYREAVLFDDISTKLEGPTGVASRLEQLYRLLTDIRDSAWSLIADRSERVDPPLDRVPSFEIFQPDNLGEAGCFGWPTQTSTGTVTAAFVPRLHVYPPVLTRDLELVLAFLTERERIDWFDYVRALEQEEEEDNEAHTPALLYRFTVNQLNSFHMEPETFSILSIRDPQRHMEQLAAPLHTRSRDFARLAVNFSESLNDAEDPPLRRFIREYATFLSRTCVERGCDNILLRTIELTLRDECFQTFLMDRFFSFNPDARSLPACFSRYVPL